jgi:hypothetical protein
MKKLLQQNFKITSSQINLDWFITGFTDAEWCFYISITKN